MGDGTRRGEEEVCPAARPAASGNGSAEGRSVDRRCCRDATSGAVWIWCRIRQRAPTAKSSCGRGQKTGAPEGAKADKLLAHSLGVIPSAC